MKNVSDAVVCSTPFADLAFADVLVVGGGISGIQASLDLATAGYRVCLVEKAPTIGGKMTQLDKTFPTNDCSMCIESPKFLECKRHPNIEIRTMTEVRSVRGEAGDFNITLVTRPRYVDEDKCTGCTSCAEYCPVKVPDPFNQNMSSNKAIHMYFAQAIPLVPYVDEKCVFLDGKKCTLCMGICKNDAIDFNRTAQEIRINVGAIILAPGIEPFDARVHHDYGYGKFANVVTSLDYERLLCATGPYEGEIRRASDGKHPHKTAWIHCVGSRRIAPGYNRYCSGVCCTYTQKQVILTKDHHSDAECTIFHNDIRSYSKGFERFYQRAEALPGIRFIRSYVTVGHEDPVTGSISLRYSTPDDGVKEEAFDMVVLSVGLTPPAAYTEMAATFGIDLTSDGFCKTDPAEPLSTSRPGIFLSGAFQGPMDIPEAVFGASGAVARCGEILSRRRGNLSRERIYPTERDVTNEAPRIGVFICHCGANIGRVVNVPDTVDYALSLPGVVHAQEQLFSCATNSAKEITDTIREKQLNRVIVAACTPRTHEPVFRDTLREGGINQYFYDMVNIREHCSWVHTREKEAATEKSKDLIRMSVARTHLLEPLNEFNLPVDKTAVVVGGGISGMTSAISLARQGFEVHLIEKEAELGGMARRLYTTLDGMDVQAYLKQTIREVYQNPRIHVRHSAVITDVAGYVGNFTTTVKSATGIRSIRHGAVILATGADEYQPVEYEYGKNDTVMTQLSLESRLHQKDEAILKAETVVMIQCVGCRNEERNYCSRICCTHAVKNAITLKQKSPETDIYILFRDMRTYGLNEDYYRQAADMGVRFIRYEPETAPQVESATVEGRPVMQVTVTDPILGHGLQLDADFLILSAAVVPAADIQTVAKQYKVALSPEGFFQEAHVKLRPVDFAAEGVFLCGIAHYPKHLSESIAQAGGAAGRAGVLLSQETVTASGSVCEVDESRCISCGACITACSYGAIEFRQTDQGRKAAVIPVLCKGDGLCNAKCPTEAIQLKHYTDTEILHQLDAAFCTELPVGEKQESSAVC